MRCQLAGLVFVLSQALTVAANGAGPADPLLRLVPADAGVTLVLEDLRGHTREFFASPLAEGIGRLPAVRAWLESGRFRGFQDACHQIETMLGKPLSVVRDDLLGDAVVLTLRLPVHGRQDDARGMLLVRARDRNLLDRLIDGVNAAQKQSGELLRLTERPRGGLSYWVREFPAATRKPAEYYAVFDDNTFAWSNSEPMVQGVVDRKRGGRDGLGDAPHFRKVRDRLPARSALGIYVDPRFLEGVMDSSPKPSKPGEERLAAMLGHYVEALDYLGAAIEWRGAPSPGGTALILHTEELIDPEKLPPWFGRWAARPANGPRWNLVPAGALAVASANLDFNALDEVLRALTPPRDQRKRDNLQLVLNGLMLGRDFRSAILPMLGPGVLAYLEERAEAGRGAGLSLVLSVELGEPGVAAALDNALRTVLATYALDPKHGGGQLQVETRAVRDMMLTTLIPTSPFAYAVGQGRIVLGRNPESVARGIAVDPPAEDRFLELRGAYFPGAETFLCADLERIHRFADSHRAAIAKRMATKNKRTLEEAGRDLDQALALMGLFREAFLTSSLAQDARSAHRMFGLTVRERQAPQSR